MELLFPTSVCVCILNSSKRVALKVLGKHRAGTSTLRTVSRLPTRGIASALAHPRPSSRSLSPPDGSLLLSVAPSPPFAGSRRGVGWAGRRAGL